MGERMNGRDPSIQFRQKTRFNERPGILAAPSSELLKRRQAAALKRQLGATSMIGIDSTSTFSYIQKPPILDENLQAESLLEGGATEVVVLPIDKYRDQIVDMVLSNRASGVVSETGGGKTTRVPQFLMDAGIGCVYVGEPRRATVDGPGARVQYELDQRLGAEEAEGLVDTIHGGRAIRHENSRIAYATAASLARMLPDIEKRAKTGEVLAICIDEVHEDDLYIEALFGAVGILASKYSNIHVVCMSATMNEEILKIPLGRITNFEHPGEVEIPFIHVEGRPFKYTAHEKPGMNPAEVFLEAGSDVRVSALADRGYEPIRRIREAVIEGYEAREPGSSARLIFKEFSGRISTRKREEIARLAEELADDQQLVILGTPAMMSGVTIPGLQFLAFGGMMNREQRREDRARGTVIDYASKAEVIQFFGRAGRDTDDAHVYLTNPMPSRRDEKGIAAFKSIYPYKAMKDRDDYAAPSIFTGNFTELLLLGISSGAKPESFNKHIINEQSHERLREAIERLHAEFGAIDEDNTITEVGRLMGRFPVAPELGRGLAEAMMQGRSKDQLARMAIIATAIDTGGYQLDRVAMEDAQWRSLLRSGSTDDFIAQFDFWDAFQRNGLDNYASHDGFMFSRDHDLDYGRYLSTDETTEKTLRRIGVNPHNLSIDPPTYDEIKQIRNDFTSGMYGLTYRETRDGKRADDEKYYFDPVVDPAKHPQRELLKSSVLEPGKGEIVAGMPTFRQRIKDGYAGEVELLGSTLKVNHETIGHFALAGNRVEYVTVPNTARMDGGMVQESRQGMFGSLKVGSHVTAKELRKDQPETVNEIPLESRRKLIDSIQSHPGNELRELRKTAEMLAEYRRILTPELIEQYRYQDAPVDVTLTYIANLLDNYAQRTRNAQEIDQLIGKHAESNGISVDLYYSTTAQQEMLQRSPDYVNLGSGIPPLRILYSNGRPYATNVSDVQRAAIKGPLYIDEGFEDRREVLHQIKKQPRGTRRVSFGSEETT